MPDFTYEQNLAIKTRGQNIIVSAGAGSGKTEVLSERVIYHLKQGIKVNELLILTFTNAAALEMKNRIRQKILDSKGLEDNLDYLESSYITTFDSFTLSLLKKYHYILNVSPNLKIIDDSIIAIIKGQIIDRVLEKFYAEDSDLFQKLINDLTNKNDTELKTAILEIISSLERITDIDYYLDNYINNYLSSEKIDEYIEEFINLIKEDIKEIENELMMLENTIDNDFYNKLVNSLEGLIKSKTYDEIYHNSFKELPRLPKNSEEEVKNAKNKISEKLTKIKKYLKYNNVEEIKETFLIVKDYTQVLIAILKEYFKEIREYKIKEDLYEFNDIAIMAIKLLKENASIRTELKESFKEILVDEYQDTNDLQEEFINLIQNNNVYMVGDIKQSIYGFRNANPYIFKNKYDLYTNNDGGIKIDLLKNFRSRSEVLEGINQIFSLIMDDEIGNANYVVSHQMNAGNDLYLKKNANQNYNLEIYNYDSEGEILTNPEIEAFIIGNDILKKIKDNYQVIDKKQKELRNVQYSDFCIIMDRGTNFAIYKKIFEYLGIPLSIYEDRKLTNEIDIILINNIVSFILKVKDNIIDIEFKYYFMSIARSFLFEYNDNLIFKIMKDNTFKDTDVYKISLNIASKIDTLDSYELLTLILKEFDFYEKIIKIGNVEEIMIRLDNLLDISKNLSTMGYTILMFKEYLEDMINSKNEIKYSVQNDNTSSVKIMNIHKSKGLEFPICYFSGYDKVFNDQDVKKRFIYTHKYGIIMPYFKEGIGSTILKDLYKNDYYKKSISEKIRLFYVALTRAKEKIIIVSPLNEEKNYVKGKVDVSTRLNYKSFLDILNSISGNLTPYVKNIDLANLNLSKDYLTKLQVRENITKQLGVINYHTLNIPNTIIEEKKASKVVNDLITEEKRELLQMGSKVHKIFEQTDFLNISNNNPYQKQIANLVKKLNITKDTKIYKEYEFINYEQGTRFKGIIDLVLIDKDIVKIVDYKLKNIEDEKYDEQLKVYYNYLKNIFKQEIKMYLYSIFDDEIREIKKDF